LPGPAFGVRELPASMVRLKSEEIAQMER
jgi:hypothetical protein